MTLSETAERFIKYAKIGTTSAEDRDESPSTECQWKLALVLEEEMRGIGIQNVRVSEHGYVFGEIPASEGSEGLPGLGFIAHMDTSPSVPGDHVRPRVIEKWDGKPIALNEDVSFLPHVRYLGQDLIVTDGRTLLGADDKAGVAEIMTMAERLIRDPSIRHGRILIGFTPDEEVGRGTAFFDVEDFGAEIAYTVDGGMLGELEYENFNAASAVVDVKGYNIHPGAAKGLMKNAAAIAAAYDGLLPESERPGTTEGYEGYYHLTSIEGTTEAAALRYILRDFEADGLEARKAAMTAAAEKLAKETGADLTVTFKDSYRNMKEMIEPRIELIDAAERAFRKNGVEPVITPCRGGTDGATLSYMGLPCPNLSAGGENMHSVTEYVSIQTLDTMADVLVDIARAG